MGTHGGRRAEFASPELVFACEAPVRGRMAILGGLLVATLDRRSEFKLQGGGELVGIGAFDPKTGVQRWAMWGIPALAGVDGATIYAYSRAGLIVALSMEGRERWRAEVPDDRSVKGQLRGDRDAPFVADVVPCGSSIALATGSQVWWLSADDGRALAQAMAGHGECSTISRITAAESGSIVATCTERTAWDDEIYPLETWLWQPAPTLESLRTAASDVVAFGPGIERWRLAPPVAGVIYGNRRPVATADGAIILVAARTAMDGPRRYVSLSGDWIVAVDASTGVVRWQRDMPGGRGHFDPVAIPGGVVAGFEPVCYASIEGAIRWHLRSDQVGLNNTAAPLLDGGRLLFVGEGVILATTIDDGVTSAPARFARHPFIGSVTTNLVNSEGILYLGVKEAQCPTQLRAVALPPANQAQRLDA